MVWFGAVNNILTILFFFFSEVIFDKKRHLIGEEFFRHPVPNSESNKSVDHISAAEDLTRIPTIVSPSKYNFLNNRFLRERGMASNPKMEYQVFLCIFQKNSAMATLGLKEMGKFLWEGREKVSV